MLKFILIILNILGLCYLVAQTEWFYQTQVFPRLGIKASNVDVVLARGLIAEDLEFENNKIKYLEVGYNPLALLVGEARITELKLCGALFDLTTENENSKGGKSGSELYPELPLLVTAEKIILKNVRLKLSEEQTLTLNTTINNLNSDTGAKLTLDVLLQDEARTILDGRVDSSVKLFASRESINFKIEGEASDAIELFANVKTDLKLTSGGLSFFISELEARRADDVLGTLSGEVELGEDIKVSDLEIEVPGIAQLKLNASYQGGKLEGELVSRKLVIDKLLELVDSFAGEGSEETQESEDSKFAARLDLKLDGVSWENNKIEELQAEVVYGSEVLEINALEGTLNNGKFAGDFKGSSSDLPWSLTGDVNFEDVMLKPFQDDLSGKISRLKIKSEDRNFDIRAKFEDVAVPSYMQDHPPFNILFLPITALDHTVGTLGSALLPDAITSVTSQLKDAVRNQGKIVFDTAQIKAVVNEEAVVFSDTNFNGDVIPTLTLKGRIGFDEKLKLTMGIELLKVPVPLPVAGTLSTPLPDLVAFVPELVKSLGLGVVNIGGVFVSEDEAEFFEKENE